MSEDKSASQFLLDYRSALECLKPNEKDSLSDRVIDVLMKRDSLQNILSESSKLTANELKEVESLDRSLKEQKEVILQVPNLSELRSLIKPPESNWWWYVSSRWDNWDWLWNGLTIAALTVSLSLVVNTSSRILSGGANSVNTLYVFGQSVLTLMVGGGAQYEVAVQSDPQRFDSAITYVKALNNLGRLYVLKKDYGTAVRLLSQGVERANAINLQGNVEARDDYYNLLKNLGWARLMQERYEEAEAKLTVAVKVNPDRSAAYCLLAQVLEAKVPKDSPKDKAKVVGFWTKCASKATPSDLAKPEDDDWHGLANKRLSETVSSDNSNKDTSKEK